jgi:hypothetical protein
MPRIIRPFPSKINRELLFSGDGEYRRKLTEQGINEQEIGKIMKDEIRQAWIDAGGSENDDYLQGEMDFLDEQVDRGWGVLDAITFTDGKVVIVKEADRILKNIFTDSLQEVLAKEEEELAEEELSFIRQYQQAQEKYDQEEYEVDGGKLKFHTWKILAEIYQKDIGTTEKFLLENKQSLSLSLSLSLLNKYLFPLFSMLVQIRS